VSLETLEKDPERTQAHADETEIMAMITVEKVSGSPENIRENPVVQITYDTPYTYILRYPLQQTAPNYSVHHQ
jgi:hypothetical protein